MLLLLLVVEVVRVRLGLVIRLSVGGGLSGFSIFTIGRSWRYDDRVDKVTSEDVEEIGECSELSCE